MLPLKVRKYAAPPDHLRSEISSRALAAFQIIGKVRKQGEALFELNVQIFPPGNISANAHSHKHTKYNVNTIWH